MNFWTEEEKEIVLQLVTEDKLYREISNALGDLGYRRSPSAIQKFVKRLEDKAIAKGQTKPCCGNLPEEVSPKEDQWRETTAKIAQQKTKMFNLCVKKYNKLGKPDGSLTKVLSLSDLHVPFENNAVIEDALDKHSDSDILVLNGDLLDLFSVSRWPKNKSYPLKHEYTQALDWLKLFSKQFKQVVLIRGNHELRLQSYFSSNLDPGISFMTHPDPLERLASGYGFDKGGHFVKTHEFNNVLYTGGICGWYAKIGNTIFVHPSGGSGVPMRTALKAANHFIEIEDFEAIVCSHTHKMGKIFWKNKLLIEQGCCCIPMDYEADAHMKWNQQTFGYAVVYMNSKGKIDFEKSGPVYYGTGSAVKTDIRL